VRDWNAEYAAATNPDEFGSSSREATAALIDVDISRTFPELDGYSSESSTALQELLQILEIYVHFRPDVGYVQGMSFIGAVLQIQLKEQFRVFIAMANLLTPRYHLLTFFKMDVKNANTHLITFDLLLQDQMPKLHAHLWEIGLRSELYCVEWFVVAFAKSLPLPIVLRIWDLLLMEEHWMYAIACGVLKYYSDFLTVSTFDEAFEFLTHLPTTVDETGFFNAVHSIEFSVRKLNVLRERAAALSPDVFGEYRPQLKKGQAQPS